MEGLKAADEVMVDATFSMTPLVFTQMFIIHFLYQDKVIKHWISYIRALNLPMAIRPYFFCKRFDPSFLHYSFQPLRGIYIYMTKKTTKAYMRVLEAVDRITGGLNCQCKILMMDWEEALRNCFQERYPGVRIFGCWFHYGQVNHLLTSLASQVLPSIAMNILLQALYRKLCDVGLRNEHRTNQVVGSLFAMAVALLLLPGDTMADAFHVIELCWSALDESAFGLVADGHKANFGKFLEYVKVRYQLHIHTESPYMLLFQILMTETMAGKPTAPTR
jgi:hypothetical protein